MGSFYVQVLVYGVICVIFASNPNHQALVTASFTGNYTVQSPIEISAQLFSQKLISEWGNNGVVDAAQLGEILERLGIYDKNAGKNGTEQQKSNCSAESVFRTHGVEEPTIDAAQLQNLCPFILYSAAAGQCAFPKLLQELPSEKNETDTSPTPAEVWGYGFLFVTIINLGALAGVWVVPIMNKKLYKMVLMFLICLAVGTLCGNAILSLIPEAHGMYLEDYGEVFVWKNMTIVGGIYLFFLTERILKMISQLRRQSKRNIGKRKPHTFHTTAMHDDEPLDNGGIRITSPSEALHLQNSLYPESEKKVHPGDAESGMDMETLNSSTKLTNGSSPAKQSNGHAHSHSHNTWEEGDSMIASVAYMIIFGDGLHNFIDGLAIGASFAHATYAGVSTSIAVICEEFPHELGDFAILLNSGMSVKNAVLANLGSSLTCYAGLVIGILLGEMTEAGEWIFAIAGGMFLYISLVDMLPEINSVTNAEEDEGKPATVSSMLKVFFLQNAGLLSGFGLMLLLALYAGKIQI